MGRLWLSLACVTLWHYARTARVKVYSSCPCTMVPKSTKMLKNGKCDNWGITKWRHNVTLQCDTSVILNVFNSLDHQKTTEGTVRAPTCLSRYLCVVVANVRRYILYLGGQQGNCVISMSIDQCNWLSRQSNWSVELKNPRAFPKSRKFTISPPAPPFHC
jgi:hypothetical protein